LAWLREEGDVANQIWQRRDGVLREVEERKTTTTITTTAGTEAKTT
jgi:hypothetical protein